MTPMLMVDFIGNSNLKDYLARCLCQGKGKKPNLLITGDPGTGKTTISATFFRQLLDNPTIGMQDDDFRDYAWGKHDYRFLVIHGSTISEAFLRERISEAVGGDCAPGGVYVLIDELGEIWVRKLDMAMRPLLDASHVTTIATAQNFKGLEKISTNEHERKRWEALDRRFPVKISTQLPTEKELAMHLARKLHELEMKLDNGRTLITLARKFQFNPSRCLNVIEAAYARGCERFTENDVAEA